MRTYNSLTLQRTDASGKKVEMVLTVGTPFATFTVVKILTSFKGEVTVLLTCKKNRPLNWYPRKKTLFWGNSELNGLPEDLLHDWTLTLG